VLKNRLRGGARKIDNFVQKIGDAIPFRMRVDPHATPVKKNTDHFEQVRKSFVNHKPSIIVGRHLGTGGFADVFMAKSNYDGVTDFAIKILRPDLLVKRTGQGIDEYEEEMRIKDVKKRFKNESFVQWDLSQSVSQRVANSVVTVYDHGEFDTRHDFRFILMELMGSTLRHYIKKNGNRTDSFDKNMFKLLLMTKIADIINNIHSEGIFHRDIKPENILFSRDADLVTNDKTPTLNNTSAQNISVKLGDFGTVRWVKSYTSKYDAIIIGSQFYMSPEQIYHPENLDQRTDIYSFGLVCYELLYGEHPKNLDPNTPSFLDKLAREAPKAQTPPPQFEGLHDIIMRCLLRTPQERYQSMAEVVSQMRDYALGLYN